MLKKQKNFLSIPNLPKKRAVTFEKSQSPTSVKPSANQSFIIHPQVEDVQTLSSAQSDFRQVKVTSNVQAQLKTIKWPSKIINENDVTEMKRLSKPHVHKPVRIMPKSQTSSEKEILQRNRERRKQQMQTLDDQFKEQVVKDIEEKTNDFLQFAKDQGAFDWQLGGYKDVKLPTVSKSVDITQQRKEAFLKPQLQLSQDSHLSQNKQAKISFKISNVEKTDRTFERGYESLRTDRTPTIEYNYDLKKVGRSQIVNERQAEIEKESGNQTMPERHSSLRVVDDSRSTKKKLGDVLDLYGLQQTSVDWMTKRKQSLEPHQSLNIQVIQKSTSALNSQRSSHQPIFVNPVYQKIKIKSTFAHEGSITSTPAGKTADVPVNQQKLKKDTSEVQFKNNRRNQFYQISSQEIDLKQMPKLLQKYQKRVEENKTQAIALQLNRQRRKIVKSTVKSYFNNNYEDQKKGLEQQLRDIKVPTTMFKEKPSPFQFKQIQIQKQGSNTERKKKQVYANEEDQLLDKMTQIAAENSKYMKQITEPLTPNKIKRLKSRSDSSKTMSAQKISLEESDNFTYSPLETQGSFLKTEMSSFKEKPSKFDVDFQSIAIMEELSLQIRKGIANMFQQKIQKSQPSDLRSRLKPAMQQAINVVRSKMEDQTPYQTQPSKLKKKPSKLLTQQSGLVTQQSRLNTQPSRLQTLQSGIQSQTQSILVTETDQPKKEPTAMQLKFRAAIFAKFSGEVDQKLEKKFGRQITSIQNELPADVKEPEEEHEKHREGIYKKYEWFKDQFGNDSLTFANFNLKRGIFQKSIKYLVLIATSKVAEAMSKRRLLRQEAAKKQDTEFTAMKEAEIRRTNDEEILRESWDSFVDMFQDFVLVFSNIQFTKGKRRMLLFLVLKAEADIFQELREYDRALKAYKCMLTYCELWKFKEAIINLNEQIGMCYRLMRLHNVAVDCFKMELQHAWANKDYEQELKCYNLISQEYYYIGEMQKMKLYYDRYITGTVASDQSLTKKSAIIAVQSFKPGYDIFQSQRRGLSVRDEEKLTDFSKSKHTQCLPYTQFTFISKKQRELIEKLNIIDPKQLAWITIPDMFRPYIKSNILQTDAAYTKIDMDQLKEIESYMLQKEKQELLKQWEFQKAADKIETLARRTTNRLKFSNMGHKELKDYKITNYSVANLNDRREYSAFDDEKYVRIVNSSKDKQFYGGNMVDISWQHPFRGHQSTLRFQQLHEVEDHTQLKTIKAMFKKMESEMNRLLENFYEDSKQDFDLKMKLLRKK